MFEGTARNVSASFTDVDSKWDRDKYGLVIAVNTLHLNRIKKMKKVKKTKQLYDFWKIPGKFEKKKNRPEFGEHCRISLKTAPT